MKKDVITYLVSCPSPHISSLHSQTCVGTHLRLDSAVGGKKRETNLACDLLLCDVSDYWHMGKGSGTYS